MTTDYELLQQVEAEFRPRREDDLRDEVRAFIGRRMRWTASWIIEEGQYAGEWAMVPDHSSPMLLWAPSGDLVI